ncbi:MAG TPA: shikimate kinase [Candidatus Saccharimonadales bacterium]|nr:shikimate kinase [Candidatus Saccharimonadales bacterium]
MKIAEIAKIKHPAEVTVNVPGSKSYTLRALFLAALCDSPPKLTGLLESMDTEAMRNCLEAITNGQEEIFAGESGITARFITALACITPGRQKITGKPGLLKRPIGDLVDALRQLGANIEYIGKDGFLPISVSSENLSESKVSLSGQTSSQYLSALLLISPKLENGLEINIKDKQISKPYIDITVDIMKSFGVEVANDDYQKYIVKPQKYQANEYAVEGDYSSAAYFYAINALAGSNIKVRNLNLDSKQGDKKFVDMIKNKPAPKEINAEDFPDQAMTLAVLAAFAEGKTVISGVKSLRVKETERVKAAENELAKMDIKTESTEDRLTIYGGKPQATKVETYGDHRIAMSFAVASAKLDGMTIFNPEVVDKTFPGFWDELDKLTEVKISELKPDNILLIGMRGSGKSTIGKILAKELGMDFVDMDTLIELKQGLKVRDIVEKNGWAYFRELESKICAELAQLKNTVMASGGGVVINDKNMSGFDKNTLKILFVAEPSLLSKRIKGDSNRHGLTSQPTLLGELDEVWENRKEKYFKNTDFIFDTSKEAPELVVKNIIGKLES